MNENITTITIVLTSAVVASLVTSIANILIAILNNHKIVSIEKEKQKNSLISYRYKCLYEMLLKWQEYNTPYEIKDKEPSEIATERLFNGFFDSHRKFQIISPLLDEEYKRDAEKLNKEGEKLINELIELEYQLDKNSDEKLSQKHKILFREFIGIASSYATEIEKIVHLQLEELLKKSNV